MHMECVLCGVHLCMWASEMRCVERRRSQFPSRKTCAPDDVVAGLT
jgi:hypothetical protein